ncbi:MAG TPA: hypothetical protein VF997_11255 [Polyangia bacterium]
MMRDDFLALDGAGLAAALARGHAIDERALDDSQYRGISLGLPRAIEALTWKTFRKTFHRDPRTGRLRGWNVRLEQTGLDGPARPLRAFGHYGVGALGKTPRPCGPGLLIDYSAGTRGPMGRLRDPIVAVDEGGVELLLGWSFVDLGVMQLPTPSYFLLVREGPLDEIVTP